VRKDAAVHGGSTPETKAGREADVTVCGEVASEMHVFPQLVRMGYRSFSISPVSAAPFRSVCADFNTNDPAEGEK